MKLRTERRQQAIDEDRRARSIRRSPPPASSMLMLREVSTRIATTASRALGIGAARHGAQQEEDEREKGNEAQRDEDAASLRRQRAPAVGEPCDEAGGRNDEGESPPGKRVREGHAGLLLPGQRFVVSGDQLSVVVWHAIAAAGTQAILKPLPRSRCDHRRLVALESRVDVLPQRFPLRKILLERLGALVDADSTRVLPGTRRQARRPASRVPAARATRARACSSLAYCSRRRCASSLDRGSDRVSNRGRARRAPGCAALPLAAGRASGVGLAHLTFEPVESIADRARLVELPRQVRGVGGAAAERVHDSVEGARNLLLGIGRTLRRGPGFAARPAAGSAAAVSRIFRAVSRIRPANLLSRDLLCRRGRLAALAR